MSSEQIGIIKLRVHVFFTVSYSQPTLTSTRTTRVKNLSCHSENRERIRRSGFSRLHRRSKDAYAQDESSASKGHKHKPAGRTECKQQQPRSPSAHIDLGTSPVLLPNHTSTDLEPHLGRTNSKTVQNAARQ